MIQKILLPVAVFIVLLVGLTFGERVGHEAWAWFSYLTGLALHNFSDLIHAVQHYVSLHTGKVIIAIVLTAPVSYWIIRNRGPGSGTGTAPRANPRKIAIVLAILLGWLGAHRFYLGQVGWGIIYLILFYIFTPLVVAISLIDAVRYAFMTDADFPAPAR